MSLSPKESHTMPATQPVPVEGPSVSPSTASPQDRAQADGTQDVLQDALRELDSQLNFDELEKALRDLLGDC